MDREFTAENMQLVAGNVSYNGNRLFRTPLHVAFSDTPYIVRAHKIFIGDKDTRSIDPLRLNAVGSLALTTEGQNGIHLPVIDVEGGVIVQKTKRGSRATVMAKHDGTYKPQSVLRDILSDHGIDLEVIHGARHNYDRFASHAERTVVHYVGAVILRSSQDDIFEDVDSTTRGHSHLYIQEAFEDDDHRTLLFELGEIGVISPMWFQMAEREGMGVVRTPWTQRKLNEYPS